MKNRRQVSAMAHLWPDTKNGMIALREVYLTLKELGRVLEKNGAKDKLIVDFFDERLGVAVLTYGTPQDNAKEAEKPKATVTRKR